ncbi:MAG: ABC transporter ATP-binding protein [Candidatus Delongbacteria bacterium]|nr:ABC transporter ATP-binding protein [Candidatus Delongbacteria bacterium]MBN2835447.1 ABC transporter ATP-binding protein [Candidatus Delongbacteria bacterium]
MRDFHGQEGKITLSTFRRVLPFFKGYGKILFVAVTIVLINTALISALPLVFREMLDNAIPSKEMSQVFSVGLLYLFMLLTQGAMDYLRALYVGFMGIEIINNIKIMMLKHVIRLSLPFFNKTGTGTLISRIESDSQKLFMLFSDVGLQILGAVLNLITSIVIMSIINFKLSLIVFAIVPIYVIGTYLIFKKMKPMFKKDRELYARILGFLNEHIKAIPLLRNLNSLEWSIDKFRKLNEEKWKFEMRLHLMQQIVWFLLLIAPQFAIAAILYKSVNWVYTGTITIGTIWMFIQYINAAIWPLIMISEQIGEVQRAFGSAERIFDILDTEREVKEHSDAVDSIVFNNEIKFDNVSFAYDPNKPVLKNISFTIKKGMKVGIVGPTGSGKTTIMALLSRFYDPYEGSITIDGINLKQMTFKALRDKLNLVLQDIYLFPGNITDNLRVLRSDIDLSSVKRAVEIMGIDDIIQKFQNGYDTELSEDGGNLSFGERQLLSFARALTFDPEILIMDEATSSVDPLTEARIQSSMDKLFKGRTSIVIAHRLSTIIDADLILVIVNGILKEQGTHEELYNLNGVYHKLYSAQNMEV